MHRTPLQAHLPESTTLDSSTQPSGCDAKVVALARHGSLPMTRATTDRKGPHRFQRKGVEPPCSRMHVRTKSVHEADARNTLNQTKTQACTCKQTSEGTNHADIHTSTRTQTFTQAKKHKMTRQPQTKHSMCTAPHQMVMHVTRYIIMANQRW